MSKNVFDVDNITYSYPRCQPVLRNITFQVNQGESVAVLGANACGKSTLMHLLDGLYFPQSGAVKAYRTILTEESVETPPFARQFRQQVGFLFQNSDAALFCNTVEEELAFGPLQLRLPAEQIETRVEDVIKMFGIEHLRHRSPQTLSGGEKKKVALAAIVCCGSKVILLDEPSASLDPRMQQWLSDFLNQLHEAGVTLIMSSHDLHFVSEVSDRALILSEEHRLVYDGPVADALADLNMLRSVNLIHAHAHKQDGRVHEHVIGE
ncbi:MAG: energy-coupling factor ABC transporter ATP-binding protein [Armatimonadota bacterium]